MIYLPINLAKLLVIVMVGTPLLCATFTVLTNRWHSKRERRTLKAREAAVADREDKVSGREWVVAERERLYLERSLELGRQAHDTDTMIKATINQAMDDTQIAMPRFEDER